MSETQAPMLDEESAYQLAAKLSGALSLLRESPHWNTCTSLQYADRLLGNALAEAETLAEAIDAQTTGDLQRAASQKRDAEGGDHD